MTVDLRGTLLLALLPLLAYGPGSAGPDGGLIPLVPATSGPNVPCTPGAPSGKAKGVWHDYDKQADVPFELPETERKNNPANPAAPDDAPGVMVTELRRGVEVWACWSGLRRR